MGSIHEGVPGTEWTAVVFTCQNKNSAAAYQHELEMRQKKGLISKDTLILAVEDPKSHVGSGGATLNALLIVAEHLGARQGFTVVTPEVLEDARILIMHSGQLFPFDPCGRAFVTVPMSYHGNKDAETLVCNIDLLLYQMTHKVAVNAPPGVWLCSTDMFLEIPTVIDSSKFRGEDVCVLTVPCSLGYASWHGVYKINEQGYCQDILFRASENSRKEVSMPDGRVCLVTGLMYFSVKMASHLLSFHTMPPLDACTYIGLDSGADPLKLSIFFDFLLAMCEEVTEEAFVTGPRSGVFGTSQKLTGPAAFNMQTARSLLWRALHGTKIKVLLAEDGRHSYMTADAKTHHEHLLHNQMALGHDAPFAWKRSSFSYTQNVIDAESVVINSVVEPGVSVKSGNVIVHSYLKSGIHLGHNNIIQGIQPRDYQNCSNCSLDDDIILQSWTIRLPSMESWNTHRVLVILGVHDFITKTISEGGTFCNVPWLEFLEQRKIKAEDVWPSDVPTSQRCLQNARLFPIAHIMSPVTVDDVLWFQKNNGHIKANKWFSTWRLSLEDILAMVDIDQEFQMRRKMFVTVAEQHIRSTLLGTSMTSLTSLYRAACRDGLHDRILKTLDDVACECQNPGVAARTLANIADVLGCMAEGEGGMRSGPAANQSWDNAFQYLENENIVEGVQALAAERQHWLDRSYLLVRAARHYEGAARILIRRAVMSSKIFMVTEPDVRPVFGEWIVVECPARADLAGGWSDTPPITYEHGGAVFNVALTIDGKKPIGVRARRIPQPKLVLHIVDKEQQSRVLTLTKLSDLSDYSQPHAAGSLLKAAFCCANIVQYPSEVSLADQLTEQLGGGFEMFSWSDLPHGSGLGTSSILAGAVIAALWKGAGRKFSTDALNHAVLHLEQLLTTGGGWQDQVGGLIGGLKVGYSDAALPLKINVTPVVVSEDVTKALEERLILVYTGTTRLARNLLQNVIRTWYARDPEIWETEDKLVQGAWEIAEAAKRGDLEMVGACMDRYWMLKKKMAPGSEPAAVTSMINVLRPHIYGMTMAGAGGGGFMYVLMKEGNQKDFVESVLRNLRDQDALVRLLPSFKLEVVWYFTRHNMVKLPMGLHLVYTYSWAQQ